MWEHALATLPAAGAASAAPPTMSARSPAQATARAAAAAEPARRANRVLRLGSDDCGRLH